jgi:hypothetical protein
MLTNQEPDWNIDDLTDTEIHAAIRYLEADPGNDDKQGADEQDNERDKDSGVVICISLYIFLLGCLAFMWFYWR